MKASCMFVLFFVNEAVYPTFPPFRVHTSNTLGLPLVWAVRLGPKESNTETFASIDFSKKVSIPKVPGATLSFCYTPEDSSFVICFGGSRSGIA